MDLARVERVNTRKMRSRPGTSWRSIHLVELILRPLAVRMRCLGGAGMRGM